MEGLLEKYLGPLLKELEETRKRADKAEQRAKLAYQKLELAQKEYEMYLKYHFLILHGLLENVELSNEIKKNINELDKENERLFSIIKSSKLENEYAIWREKEVKELDNKNEPGN